MGGLDNLAELKVLNLAGNQIRKISNMQGLISLEELNIRRNRIRSTTGLVSTTLEKLFISNNELQVYLFKVIHLLTYIKGTNKFCVETTPCTVESAAARCRP